MSLQLNVSNSLEKLAVSLSASLHDEDDIFRPFNVVTQTSGMNNWLKIQLADYLGISANIKFIQPNDVISQVYYLLGGRFREVLNRDHLTWLLFKILGELEFIHKFHAVSGYYDKNESDSDIKRLSLAEKTADLFDQYQIYRPEMIGRWNETSLESAGSSDWQMYLWIKACILSENSLPDKTIVSKHIITELKSPQQRELLMKRLPAIHIFGLSIITNYHLQVFYELSTIIDVSFYILNPAPSVYFFEDKNEKQLLILKNKGYNVEHLTAGNQLLLNWGRVIQDTFNIFFRTEEFINAYNEIEPVEPGTDSLLKKIQSEIFLNQNQSERAAININDVMDGSVSINSCYTVAREVEALYNSLVHLVDTAQSPISAREIIVMVTDIDAYAPYIKAVFNNAPYRFPYSIADESAVGSDSLISAVKSVLLLNKENFTSEGVLQLLDSAYIRNRFQLSDVPLIRQIVSLANIRFGIDGSKNDDTLYVSWSYGIKRIIYGICMSGEHAYDTGDTVLYPLDRIEGVGSWEIIRFCHFVEVLISSIKSREGKRTLAEWVLYTEQLLSDLVYEPTDEPNDDFNHLVEQLQKLNALNSLLAEKIGYEVFCHDFVGSFSEITRSGSFAMGGITFCSLIPMRSIPSRVIAVLGLNFDKFPRKNPIASFSLMDADKRKGDRNIKDNDKHLFLETILSAKEHLYLSYIGQSTKDNTVVPPSALVDELIDYIAAGSTEEDEIRKQLVVNHPLNSYSPKYNSTDSRLYSYLTEQSSELKLIADDVKEQPSLSFDEVLLTRLISVLKNPFKGYYNNVLGIYYTDEQMLVDETELFELDHLQKWSLKRDLLRLDSSEAELLKEKMVKTGELPLKNMADVFFDKAAEEVAPVKILFEECVNEAIEQSLTASIAIDGSVVTGTIDSIFDDNLVYVSYSKNECKYLIDAAIRYLFIVASGTPVGVLFISAEKNEVFKGIAMSEANAQRRLAELLRLYKIAHEKILCFYPDFKIVPGEVAELDFDQFKKKVNDKLDNYKYPCTDKYIMKEFDNDFFETEESFDDYKAYAGTILSTIAEIFPGYYI